MPAASQPIDEHARAHRPTRRIRSVPVRRMRPGRTFPIHQRRQPLPEQVEHLQAHVGSGWYLVGNDRRGIERVGIILPQRKILRQGRAAHGCQRQGKIPGLVRGRAHGAAQVG